MWAESKATNESREGGASASESCGLEAEYTLSLYREFAAGIVAVQDDCGMWHQVLDRPDTYLETSCTAMFVLSLKRGANRGWLGEEFALAADKGWNALLRYALDKEGNVHGVCLGSGCSMEVAYYDSIPTHRNDDHGTSIILMAAAEMMRDGNKE